MHLAENYRSVKRFPGKSVCVPIPSVYLHTKWKLMELKALTGQSTSALVENQAGGTADPRQTASTAAAAEFQI